MKKIYILLMFIMLSLSMTAQQYATYNQKGDEAMKRQNYTSARMWYSEGLEYCDIYSIEQLTKIWLENENMRFTMRNLMTRCLDCLNDKAKENDLPAIKALITYYTEGIGGSASEEVASYWNNRLNELQSPPQIDGNSTKTSQERMKFFIGYAFSTEMPYGITLGGIQEKFGWYVRLRSNFSFQNSSLECALKDGLSVITNPQVNKAYQADDTRSNKKNSISGTAGFIYKSTSWLSTSIGVGYGERALLSPFIERDKTNGTEEAIWCRNQTYSSKGIVAEVDAILHYKNYFLSVGCHTINFDYVDLNAGIGIFF